MSITKKTVDHIATLARIELTEKEEQTMADEMSTILQYVDQFSAVDADTKPATHVVGAHSVFRHDGDAHDSGKYTDTLLRLAPRTKKGYVIVTGIQKK